MAGIYIHIPFCKQRCTYCDFHFSTTFESYRSKMIETMCQEINSRAKELKSERVETIYFGGGTPSLLKEDEFQLIFNAIRQNYSVSEDAEITLEANPDDIQIESLRSWIRNGFNRLSIGIQSFREEDLQWMNRAHNSEEAKNCVQVAQKEGFDAISVDLIYGLPNLTNEIWKKHIQTVVDFGVDHISAYCLTIEEKTVLHKKVKEGQIIPSNDYEQSEQFELLRSELKNSGYMAYEISNFSKPGKEAKHNSSYWKGEKYIGIGPSAHSYDGNIRRFNISNNQVYIKMVPEGNGYFDQESLSSKDRFNELLMTGLRTIWGVKISDLQSLLKLSASFTNRLNEFKISNQVEEVNGTLFLKGEGWLMADYIASELFEC